MFTVTFLQALVERALKTAAQAAILVIGADQFNVLAASWGDIGGFAAGGFVLSALTSIASGAITDGNPSIGSAEVVVHTPEHRADE